MLAAGANLEAVQQNRPALVVADRDFLRGNPNSLLKKYNPELYDWLEGALSAGRCRMWELRYLHK